MSETEPDGVDAHYPPIVRIQALHFDRLIAAYERGEGIEPLDGLPDVVEERRDDPDDPATGPVGVGDVEASYRVTVANGVTFEYHRADDNAVVLHVSDADDTVLDSSQVGSAVRGAVSEVVFVSLARYTDAVVGERELPAPFEVMQQFEGDYS